MPTTAALAYGSAWGEHQFDPDIWSTTEEEAAALKEIIVDRFEELAADAGDPSIRWHPSTSTVTGDVYGENTPLHSMWDRTHPVVNLDRLRHRAIDDAWRAITGEDTIVSDRVNAILTAHTHQRDTRLCIPVDDDRGFYQVDISAQPEPWTEILDIADSVRHIENLLGWGRWKTAYRVVIGPETCTFFVDAPNTPPSE